MVGMLMISDQPSCNLLASVDDKLPPSEVKESLLKGYVLAPDKLIR